MKIVQLLEKPKRDYDSLRTRRLKWNNSPTIGWWQEAKPIRLYYGTHKATLQRYLKLKDLEPSKNGAAGDWVKMNLDPVSAWNYPTTPGGKSNGSSNENRMVLVFDFPNGLSDLKKLKYDEEFAGNMNRERLTDQSLYTDWVADEKKDVDYYRLTEIRLKDNIPIEYLKGIMLKE